MKLKEIYTANAAIFVIPIYIGTQRTIVFTQDESIKRKLLNSEKQVTNFDIHLKVKKVLVSLINSKKRREVCLLGFLGTGAIWYKQASSKNQKKWREIPEELSKQMEYRMRNKQLAPFRYSSYVIDLGKKTMTSGKNEWKLNRCDRPAIDLRYQIKESTTSMDLKVQNIQIDNCQPGHTWPIVFGKVPPKQTVAAIDMNENDIMMLYIQITWGSSAEHNITKYRNFHVLLQECFLNLDIDFLREVYHIFSSTTSNSIESETYRMFQEDVSLIKKLCDEDEDLKITTISFFEALHFSPIVLNFKYSLEAGV